MTCATPIRYERLAETGLDRLVETLKGSALQRHALPGMLDAALLQLEHDDTIEPRITDEMVEALFTAQEQMDNGADPTESLHLVAGLYAKARAQKDLHEVWMERAERLTHEEMESAFYLNFLEACRMVDGGEGHLLHDWLNLKAEEFDAAWERYRSRPVADHEITIESELCHDFLKRGILAWRDSLAGLKAAAIFGSPTDEVRRSAEAGQRLLIAVQLFEAEASLAEQRYFVHYN